MYPAPLVNHRFNYQPLIILPQPNEFLQTLEEKRISSLSNGNSRTNDVTNSTTMTRKRPVNSFTTRFSNQKRLISDQSSFKLISAKHSIPLLYSHSFNTLQDRIQKERRAHTMAPLAKISGPSSTPQAKLFASTYAPVDKQTNKLNPLTQKISKNYQKFDIEMTDDDAPIIVKIRYDPRNGVLPSGDAVKKAINNNIFDKKTKNDPITVNFFEQNNQRRLPNPSQLPLQPSRTFHSIPHPPHPFIHNKNIRPVQAPKPLINRQKYQFLNLPQLPNRNISSASTKELNRTDIMASQQSSTILNNQQSLTKKPDIVPSSNEVFRPPAIKDIPELSQENILNMLNQIPDLQGRRFNIEYAPPSAPEGYPIPTNLDSANNTYPEPIVIDKLPTNLIQHVKNSNNPALTAALEATIQQEQRLQSQSTVSTLNIQPAAVMHHAAQPYQQVQQSRPVSSNDSDSSTEVSSSETSSSSSEESDSEEFKNIPSTKPGNNIQFVGPIPPRSYQYR